MKATSLWYTLLGILLISCDSDGSSSTRPNIIFFLVDDQRNDVLSIEGHPVVQTPIVDQLATNRVRFTNAFVTTSICAASRASILTGLYESRHNYTFGTDPIKEEFSTISYPFLLREGGYNTGFIGKFGVRLANQDSLLNKMFDYYEPSSQSVPHFLKMPDSSIRHSTEIKGDQAISFIENQRGDKPFCLSISFNAVHAVDSDLTPGNTGHYPYPKSVANLYEGITMPEPKLSDPEIFDNHPDFMKNSLQRDRFFWRWDTPEKYQTNMRAYLRMISGIDKVIGRVIESLKKKGLDENTIIIYSADNGYYMGNRGFAGKWSHYEESLRIPLIIYDPRREANLRGVVKEQMALNIDIPSTILEYAAVDIPEMYQGRSLVQMTEEVWRANFLIEHRMEHEKIPKYVGLRGRKYVYANYYEQDPPYEYLP